MNASFTSPKRFIWFWAGLFIAPLLEYRPADSRWGVMLQAGYDAVKVILITACDCQLIYQLT
jgi:hypothetical protein